MGDEDDEGPRPDRKTEWERSRSRGWSRSREGPPRLRLGALVLLAELLLQRLEVPRHRLPAADVRDERLERTPRLGHRVRQRREPFLRQRHGAHVQHAQRRGRLEHAAERCGRRARDVVVRHVERHEGRGLLDRGEDELGPGGGGELQGGEAEARELVALQQEGGDGRRGELGAACWAGGRGGVRRDGLRWAGDPWRLRGLRGAGAEARAAVAEIDLREGRPGGDGCSLGNLRGRTSSKAVWSDEKKNRNEGSAAPGSRAPSSCPGRPCCFRRCSAPSGSRCRAGGTQAPPRPCRRRAGSPRRRCARGRSGAAPCSCGPPTRWPRRRRCRCRCRR